MGSDPWLGMVGGSYGGGIQLVSAAIDDRIDVIVPGIAWHNLDESLYTSEAFKTSYSSLLLLSLVTTGARINPQIYSGIITGAVLGILTPGQRALLGAERPVGHRGRHQHSDLVRSRHSRRVVPARSRPSSMRRIWGRC